VVVHWARELEFDFSLIFQGGKLFTQDVVVMLDDLLCSETQRVPCTARALHLGSEIRFGDVSEHHSMAVEVIGDLSD
jgi:hypothetical protein